MELIIQGNEFVIEGNIKSVGDFQIIKSAIDARLKELSSVNIVVKDSISMTSSVIGYFTKLAQKDKKEIRMAIGNDELIELLEDLGLSMLFRVRKL